MPSNDDETQRAITNAYNNTWRRENLEGKRAYEREQYAKNREARREKANQRYSEETDEQRAARAAYQAEYAKNHREALLANKRRYREKNREKVNAAERNRYWGANGEVDPKYRHKTERNNAQRAADLETLAGRPRPEVCDACGGAPDSGRALHFDHCHAQGHFRGWLCRECNLALGLMKDDPARLLKLVAYLTPNGTNS
jgi:hypothetical protein